MRWILLSLLAPAIYASNSFIDKYVLERRLKHVHSMPIYSSLAAFILGVLAWLIAGMPVVGTKNTVLLLLSGATTLYALGLYFYALHRNHTSYIIALLQAAPLFTLILSVVILKQALTGWQVAGFFVTFSAIIGLSINKFENRSLRINSAFWIMVASNLLFAVSAILIAYTVNLEGFMAILSYQSFGIFLGGALLFVFFRHIRSGFLETFRRVGGSTLGIMFLNETLFNVANAVASLAITLGPVALVSVLEGTQVFYGIIIGAVLSLVAPSIFKESNSRLAITKKVVCSILLFIGVGLIAYFE